MIIGVGTDIIEVARIRKSISNNSFYQKVYTQSERQYIESKPTISAEQSAAGIFCAKEACAKAMGTGFFGVLPKNIEILHEKGGRPYINLIKATIDMQNLKFQLSVTHTKEYAVAFAIAYTEEDKA